MKNRIFRIFSTLIIVTVLLSACSGTQPAVKTPLRVAWTLWPGYYPILIALENGYFTKHGVFVELIQYDNYQAVYPDITSGNIDGAVSGLYDLVVPASQTPLKFVMITDNSNGAEGLVATADIQTAADLKNKRIGISLGSIGEFFAVNFLRQNGLTSADVEFLNVPAESAPGQIPDQIDAGYTWEPYLSQATANNNHILASTADFPGLMPSVVAFQAKLVEQRPEDIRGFVAAWFEAVDWWQANPAEGNALIAKATGLKPEEISIEGVKIFDLAANLSAFEQGIDTTSIYFTAQQHQQFLVESGLITKPVDMNVLLDPSFLK